MRLQEQQRRADQRRIIKQIWRANRRRGGNGGDNGGN